MSDARQLNIEANTAEVTVTDTDGTEWTFELVATGLGPIDLKVRVEQEALDGPTVGLMRTLVAAPTHASVNVRGSLKSRTMPDTEGRPTSAPA